MTVQMRGGGETRGAILASRCDEDDVSSGVTDQMILLIRLRQAGLVLSTCRQYSLLILSTTIQTPLRLAQ
jgi:hypothetical protein